MTSWGGMVRRSDPTKAKRKEDERPEYPKPSERNDITIFVEHTLLEKIDKERGRLSVFIEQLNLLQNCASLSFHLGRYKSIADILNSLGIPVYIRKGIIESNHKDFFDDMKQKWDSNFKDIPEIKELFANSSTKLRGRYLRDKKIIELFPEEMETEYDGEMVEELLITTLAHEAMHAYFDRPGHEKFPYAYFVEEPLAEFGMLVYMNETGMPDEVMAWAHEDVAQKHSCYRYGAELFKLPKDEYESVRNYLEAYKVAEIGEYDVLVCDGKTAKIWYCPFSGCSLIAATPGGTVIRAGVSGAGISSKKIYLEAKSCWRGTGTELYFTIRNEIASDPAFAKVYKQGDTVNISFYDKSGVKRIVGTASIVCQHRFRACAQCKDDYACNFGTSDHRLFGFYEY